MRAEPFEHDQTALKIYVRHKPILITLDVEYDALSQMLILHVARSSKCCSHISKAPPVRGLNDYPPRAERPRCLRMISDVLSESPRIQGAHIGMLSLVITLDNQ
jgi:hypothetical protein